MYSWLLATALALSAPTPEPALDTPSQAQVMAIPPALEAQMRDTVFAGHPSQTTRLQRLIHFMMDPAPAALGISYDEDATYTVEQVYATRKANCLAFTITFLALARDAGLDAYPQEIGETLSWHESAGTIFRDNHVNAGVKVAGHPYQVDVAGNDIFGLKPPEPISDQRLMAHFYNNLGIARMELGDLVGARQLVATSLALDPAYAPHWSNAGVVALHSGDTATALQDYQHALTLDADNSSALFNMVDVLHRTGDRREAAFRDRLAEVQQRDPLQHFVQALDYERIGDYPKAIEHYKRAIQLHHGEHRFYSGLARAYMLAGDTKHAARALRSAQALSDGATRAAYQEQRRRLEAGPDYNR